MIQDACCNDECDDGKKSCKHHTNYSTSGKTIIYSSKKRENGEILMPPYLAWFINIYGQYYTTTEYLNHKTTRKTSLNEQCVAEHCILG